jgi:hypothetical protein
MEVERGGRMHALQNMMLLKIPETGCTRSVSPTHGTMKIASYSLKENCVSADHCVPSDIEWNILGVF